MAVRTERHDAPVIIVGAGPAGSTLALQLARYGLPSIVLERSLAPSRHPKMDFLNARSMELLRCLGLNDEIRALGVPPDREFTFQWRRTLDEVPLSRWHYPSVDGMRARLAAANDGSQPREPYQRVLGSRLEALGRSRCHANELVDLREGWRFTGFTQHDGGVTAEVVHDESSRRAQLTGQYLVGCDGAGSAVRATAGIGMDDLGPRAQHCDVYFRSTDPALGKHGEFFLAIFSRGLTLISRDGEQTWTGTFPLTEAGPVADPLAVILERAGADLRIDEVLEVAFWEGRLTVASAYRSGRVFLAGDAGHQFFPTGGHGANTGIADAFDLGWKLAAVQNGWAGDRLLDSYEAERLPVARFNREMCFNLLEVWRRFPALAAAGASPAQLSGFLEHERYQINNIGIHFGYRFGESPVVWPEPGAEAPWDWQRIVPTTVPGARLPSVRADDGTELFDLLGDGLTLVDTSGQGTGKPLLDEAVKVGVPLGYLAVDDDTVRRVLERPLLIVRPDQHVAWRGDAVPEDGARVLRRIFGH